MSTALLALSLLAGPLSSEAHALNPSRTYKQRPEKFNMVYTAAEAKTEDGAVLKVWDFPCACDKPVGVVLIAHNGEGNMGDYLRRVDALVKNHAVVIFDWRGYGESSEFEIDNNMYVYPHFQSDMEAMFDYVRQQHSQTFDVHGFGMGAGIALGGRLGAAGDAAHHRRHALPVHGGPGEPLQLLG